MKGPVDPVSGNPTTKVQDVGQTLTPPAPLDLAPAVQSATAGTPASTGTSTPAPSSLILSLRMVPQNLGDLVGSLGGSLGQTLAGLATNTGNTGQNAAGDAVVVIDFGHTTVKPDAGAIWDAIMSNQVVGPVQRTIKVMAFASMFAATPPGASPSDATVIKAVQVVFEAGQTVDFDASTQADPSGLMTQTIALAVPIKAYVLGTGDTSYYRYRIDLVGASGSQQGQWVSSNADSFYVQTGG